MVMENPLSDELRAEIHNAIKLADDTKPLLNKLIAAKVPNVEKYKEQFDELQENLIAIEQQFPLV